MCEEIKILKKKVLGFVKTQPGYEKFKSEPLTVSFGENDGFIVLFGEDLMVGIGGFGFTPAKAFEDFITTWKQLKGFQWIEKNK